jgi:hypothetical protein
MSIVLTPKSLCGKEAQITLEATIKRGPDWKAIKGRSDTGGMNQDISSNMPGGLVLVEADNHYYYSGMWSEGEDQSSVKFSVKQPYCETGKHQGQWRVTFMYEASKKDTNSVWTTYGNWSVTWSYECNKDAVSRAFEYEVQESTSKMSLPEGFAPGNYTSTEGEYEPGKGNGP